MTTMSDDGERSCPLCAEEMDLTDQQLKPCRCGYEICVWCWHHIIEMAEKDVTDARCPACRSPYDKERIVGTAAKCERVVAEVNAEKKQKPKIKPKISSDARKHLNSVRVIQRNLVYIIGLPSNMADENLLERREYFGQYGKVLKVSISRINGGSQQGSNASTFSVYITYAKEDEAIRCIQAVHNFVLEGKPLRACFGTTKYCRAWLRNMTCNNPDCLYLHDVGCQEDSFTKDEVISAYTRSRVPLTGSNSGTAPRRIGSVLPPPADDLLASTSVPNSKIVIRASNNSVSLPKSSPLDIGGTRKPAALPAAASWGPRTNLNVNSSSASSAQGISKEKSESFLSSLVPPSAGASIPSAKEGQNNRIRLNGRCRPALQAFCSSDKDLHARTTLSSLDTSNGHTSSAWSDDDIEPGSSPDKPSAGMVDSVPATSTKGASAWYENAYAPVDISDEDRAGQPNSSRASDTSKIFVGNHSQTLSSASADDSITNDNASWDDDMPGTGESILGSSKSCSAQAFASDPYLPSEASASRSEGNKIGFLSSLDSRLDAYSARVDGNMPVSSFHSSKTLYSENNSCIDSVPSLNSDFRRSFAENGGGDPYPRRSSGGLLATPNPTRLPCPSGNAFLSDTSKKGEVCELANGDSRCQSDDHLSNGHKENGNLMEYPKYSGRLHDSQPGRHTTLDGGESNIISNILSMDFDPWSDASVSSTDCFAKFLGQSTEQNGRLKKTNLWMGQSSSNESRFSFARQENETSFSKLSLGEVSHVTPFNSSGLHGSPLSEIQNGFSSSCTRCPGPFGVSQSATLTEKSVANPRTKTLAPPGFSAPSRFQAPPPGFSSLENYMMGGPPLMKDRQISSAGYNGDIEFIDPAILAVGKGRLQHRIDNSSYADIDPRLQLLMQQQQLSVPHQEPRFVSLNDSRNLHQNLPSLSHYGLMSLQQSRNSQWEAWNGMQGNSAADISEILRNKALGANRFFSGSEETYRSSLNRGDFGI
ncbi:uncharacterized protein LOC144706340 isoform X2 [Wolffia australiana]